MCVSNFVVIVVVVIAVAHSFTSFLSYFFFVILFVLSHLSLSFIGPFVLQTNFYLYSDTHSIPYPFCPACSHAHRTCKLFNMIHNLQIKRKFLFNAPLPHFPIHSSVLYSICKNEQIVNACVQETVEQQGKQQKKC